MRDRPGKVQEVADPAGVEPPDFATALVVVPTALLVRPATTARGERPAGGEAPGTRSPVVDGRRCGGSGSS